MGVRIENNLFYVESKNLSLIIENRNGYLLLKHLGKTIKNYKGSNSVYERDHAFSGNPTATNRTFSLDTQRQIFGQHGLGDFRKPTIQVQHSVTEVTDFRFVEAKILKGQNGPQGLPSPHSMDDTETLVLMLEDSKAQLSLTLYYTTFNNDATIASYSKLDNNSNQEVVIHKDFSFMADFPAADYEIVTLQGAYAREKTVRRQQVEQGIFSISSNRGASGHAQTPALLLCEQGVTEDAGNVFAIQLMYSGNFEAFVQKNQLNEVRVAIGINPENFSWKLAPEEYFETPVALVTHSDQGLTGISHESQNFVLKHIMLSEFSKKERPILINNWEATYFDFQREKLLELADEAKKVGIELFVLDDGWFGNRFDDNRALGDWVVNEEKLGLKVPETWDEFEQLVKDIVAKGQTPFGIAGADAWTLNGYNQLAFATATGGGKEANQYLRYSQPNAIKLSDPIMKDDIKVMDILRINGSKQKNWEGAGYTDVIGAFARGDVLMTPNGSWAITAINEQKPNFKIGTFMIPGKEKGQSLTVGAGDLAWSISATTKHPKEANAFVEYMTRPEVMQKYYDVDGSPTAIEGVKQAGEDSPLAGMTEYAFTDRHLVWLQQYWTSEADFHTLTMNYVLTGDKQGMVNDLNAFFNPMKADVD